VSLELRPVQVRLNEDAYAALRLLAEIEDKDLGEKAREILTRVLLGEAHAARLQAERLSRAVGTGSER
jgi:plasmid stability protein